MCFFYNEKLNNEFCMSSNYRFDQTAYNEKKYKKSIKIFRDETN